MGQRYWALFAALLGTGTAPLSTGSYRAEIHTPRGAPQLGFWSWCRATGRGQPRWAPGGGPGRGAARLL